MAIRFGRYGYRRITSLGDQGWQVNPSDELRTPPQACQAHLATKRADGTEEAAERGRLWLNDGSCISLKPERKGRVWAYDFVACRTEDGCAGSHAHGDR